MKKLVVTFRNFANAPKNVVVTELYWWQHTEHNVGHCIKILLGGWLLLKEKF